MKLCSARRDLCSCKCFCSNPSLVGISIPKVGITFCSRARALLVAILDPFVGILRGSKKPCSLFFIFDLYCKNAKTKMGQVWLQHQPIEFKLCP